MNTIYLIHPILAFLLSYLLIPTMRKLAFRMQLVDKPNYRKKHQEAVPLVGGITLFIVLSLVLGLSLPVHDDWLSNKFIYIATAILLITGVIDDRFDVKASLKLAIQLVLAHYVFMEGIRIESLFGLFGIHQLAPWVQYLLSITVITGVVNAFNLMDGIDGLSAGISLISFLTLTILSILLKQYSLALIYITMMSSLVAFLRYNLSKNHKVFMGDAGSLILGFIIVLSSIHLLQSSSGTGHLTLVLSCVIAILSIPVLDALRVFRARLKSGKSPFSADNTHLHHLVLATGLKHQTATLAIMILILSILGLSFSISNHSGISVAVFTILILFVVVSSLLSFNKGIQSWKTKIHQMESAANRRD